MFKIIKFFLSGVFIGMANAAPGVSGGTIAVILGVYEDLLTLPSMDLKHFKSRAKNIIPLFAGIGLGILVFARLITFLHARFPVYTDFFFMGIIVGSLSFIYECTKEEKHLNSAALQTQQESGNGKKLFSGFSKFAEFSKKDFLKAAVKLFCFAAGFCIMLYMAFAQTERIGTAEYETALNTKLFFKLFFVSAAAAAAMIIPGISGAFMLLVFGAYNTVISAASQFNTSVLLPVGLGAAAGLIAASRLVKYFLEKFPAVTYSFILGLVAGSVFHLMPSVCLPIMQRIIAGCIAVAGYIFISIITIKEKKNEQV